MRRPLQRFGPPLGWASLILVATSVPVPAALTSATPTGADKLVHITLYAVLAWLSCRAAGTSTPRALLIVALVAAFGALDEGHQRFIPGRSADAADWLADIVGGGVGVFAFQAAHRRRESVS